MKNSVKLRLFVSISLLVLFFVVVSIFLNSFFLKKYYIYEQKKMLIDTTKQLEKIVSENPESPENDINVFEEMNKISRTSNINITLFNKYGEIIFNSIHDETYGENKTYREEIYDASQLKSPQQVNFDNNYDKLSPGEYLIETQYDTRVIAEFLSASYLLKNNKFALVSTPLGPIVKSVDIANKFFVFIGFITLILGSIISFIFSGKFTKPIIKLNKITQKMCELDFSEKFIVKENDEIDQLGKSVNVLSNQLDKSLTELNDSNEKLNQANGKLKQDIEKERKIDEMRKKFISNASHELKTPLALIQGYAEGLRVDINGDKEDKMYYCEVIVDESNKMNKLVKQLLNLSEMESGNINIEREDFNLSYLIKRIIKKNSTFMLENNVDLEITASDGIIVNADIYMTEQVLVNFISNALNHVEGKKLIKINVEDLKDKIKVSVFNSGTIIPDESLDKIWNSFYKVDKARTREYGGTGLGLSIVKAIMELHENPYGVYNEENGVVFWCEFDKEKSQ
ncbi:MAG: ATP-binding protein [Clostridiaceae bacterium]